MEQTLTTEQIQALKAFAKDNGRYWKAVLRDVWMAGGFNSETGSYIDAPLMQLRNMEGVGPAWLNRFAAKTLKEVA